MTQITIPVTTYSIRDANPSRKYGSPGRIPVRESHARMLCRMSFTKVPKGATITSAHLKVYLDVAATGSVDINARGLTSAWNSNVTWALAPTYGSIINSVAISNPAANTLYDIDVTAWAVNRPRHGLQVGTSDDVRYLMAGSSAASQRPVLVVVYSLAPPAPTNLVPAGGAVSVAKPTLTWAEEPDMTQFQIQIDTNDDQVADYDTGWLAGSDGYWEQSAGAPTPSSGATVAWRVRQRTPDGDSAWSPWTEYSYVVLPTVTIVNPPATTDDGTPVLSWTVSGGTQAAWKAELNAYGRLKDYTRGWQDEVATRDWTPSKGVRSPGGSGEYTLWVRDDVERVRATNAPTIRRLTQAFTTVDDGDGDGVDTILATWTEPLMQIHGTRSEGTPDFCALYRDGVKVPIWNSSGEVGYKMPGSDFFTGSNFSVKDYTADPRTEHTWKLRCWTGTEGSSGDPTVTASGVAESVWLVDPETGDKVEVFGYNERPVVEQAVVENAVLHVPVNNGLVVEPRRRRLVRTTRAGSISGTVLNEDEDTMQEWAEGPSGNLYRLIFGKVNWPVIIGDYSPQDVFYDEACSDDRVLVDLNWWERLDDF